VILRLFLWIVLVSEFRFAPYHRLREKAFRFDDISRKGAKVILKAQRKEELP
jgi:hypothetical protein